MLRDTSDDENERLTIHHSFDTMFGDTDGFPFNVCGSPAQITDLHPPAIKMFQLWQVYINNVNPLLKISHVPTLQAQVVEAAADPAKIFKPLEALMFGIYLVAVLSLTDEEVEATFNEGKAVLLSRYHQGTQQALINAGFMRSNELMVLQAYFLYLFCIVQYIDPRSLFCLIGIAVRIATRLGLHRDGIRFGLSPFETEQRKRLWWQIVAFDKRIAEVTGSAITALSSSPTDCRLPLNVNDADLHIHAKEPPTPSTGATEMLFCLTRIELTIAAVPNGMRPNPVDLNNPFAQHKPTPSPADATTQETSSQPPTNGLDRYCAHMESTNVQPPQLVTMLRERVALQTSTSQSKPDLAGNGSTDSVKTTNGGPIAGTRMWVDDNPGLDRMGRPFAIMSNEDSMFPSLHSASQMFDEVSPDQNDVDWSYLMQPGVLGELCGKH
ncbi:unnamed protein product [Aspergillus oryzae]|nr:unnamed protein product [Aspergillus oryzae]GMG10055.1 unnamed protein product [Aspergillus oryzae]